MVEFRERTSETLDRITSFYRSVGYGGPVDDSDRFFFAYDNTTLIAVVRIATEHGEYVLRGMYMNESSRGNGIGKRMLESIAPYLNSLNRPCYCVPYSHLEGFYSTIGFNKIADEEAPGFLANRRKGYAERGSDVILMGRFI